MTGRVMVTGATGTIGGATVDALRARGVDPIVCSRDPGRDWSLDSRMVDFADPSGLATAFLGVDSLLLCSGHHPDLAALQSAAIEAAATAGVRRVVKISGSPASIFPGTPAQVAADHLAIEEALSQAPLEGLVVRPNVFMSSLRTLLEVCAQRDRPLALPLGDAALSAVDPADVGAVAAALLLDNRHGSASTVAVSGPEALTLAAIADVFREASGTSVEYQDVGEDSGLQELRELGFDEWTAEHTLSTLSLLRDRGGDKVEDGVEGLLGRRPTSWTEYLRREAAAAG